MNEEHTQKYETHRIAHSMMHRIAHNMIHRIAHNMITKTTINNNEDQTGIIYSNSPKTT